MDDPQPPSSETPPSQVEAVDLETVIRDLAQKGLAGYLADADVAREVVEWLHEETGIRRVVLKLAIKPVGTLVERAAKEGGTWLGRAATEKLKELLRWVPGYRKLVAALGSLVARFDGEIKAKREFEEILAGRRPAVEAEHSEDLAIELQAQLRLLQGDDETAAALAAIRSRLNPEPPLKLKRLPPERASRFTYRAQVAPFVGRDRELSALKAFLDADCPFRWWLVGGPGGQGKSRLAFELCLSRANAWHAGFLRPLDFDWRHWQPERPTLIVADYAARDVEVLRQAAVALCDREQHLAFPVRLLLLERDPSGPWYDKFEGTDNARYDLAASRHAEPLTLAPLADAALWQIMQTFFERAGIAPPDEGETLRKLNAIDEDARPLFASLLADAWAAGGLHPEWSKEDLLNDVLRREEDHFWKPAGVNDQDKNLLALATMAGGIAVKAALALEHALLPCASSFDPGRYAAMTGQLLEALKRQEAILAPLEPDIIGEFFVLTYLEPRHAGDHRRLEELGRLAWQQSFLNAAAFVFRCAIDFPREAALKPLLAPPSDNAAQRVLWSIMVVDLTASYCKSGKVKDARVLLEELKKLAFKPSSQPVFQELWGQGVVNLIAGYGRVRQTTAAHELWNELSALTRARRDVPGLSQEKAKGAVNLVRALCAADQLAAALAVWEETAATYPPDQWLAKAFMILLVSADEADDASAKSLLVATLASDRRLQLAIQNILSAEAGEDPDLNRGSLSGDQ